MTVSAAVCSTVGENSKASAVRLPVAVKTGEHAFLRSVDVARTESAE